MAWQQVGNIRGPQGDPGSDATVTVDDSLSSSSENPVQNKIVTSALDGKAASEHTHRPYDITGLTASRAIVTDDMGNLGASTVTSTEIGYLDGVTSGVQTQLNGKAPSIHTHVITDVTDLQTALDGKSPTTHTHGNATTSSAGFMSSGDKTKLNGIAEGANNVTLTSQLTNDSGYQTESQVQSAINTAVSAMYTVKGSCTRSTLPAYPDVGDVWNLTDEGGMNVVWNGETWDELGGTVDLTWDAISGKPSSFDPSPHTHAITDVTDLQTSLNGKSDVGHTHEISDVTELQTALDNKAPSVHTHAASDITSGVLPIAFGGTGATTAREANFNLFDDIRHSASGANMDYKVVFKDPDSNAEEGALNTKSVRTIWETFVESDETPATTSVPGLMSASDKTKLDGLSGEDYELPAATADTLGGVKIGSGVSVDETGTISVESQIENLPIPTETTLGAIAAKQSQKPGLESGDARVFVLATLPDVSTYAVPEPAADRNGTAFIEGATQVSSGAMSASDKTKLDGIDEGANAYTLPPATGSSLGGVMAQQGSVSGVDYALVYIYHNPTGGTSDSPTENSLFIKPASSTEAGVVKFASDEDFKAYMGIS